MFMTKYISEQNLMITYLWVRIGILSLNKCILETSERLLDTLTFLKQRTLWVKSVKWEVIAFSGSFAPHNLKIFWKLSNNFEFSNYWNRIFRFEKISKYIASYIL